MKERSRYFTAPNPRQPHRGTRGLRGAIPDSHAFSSDFVFGIVKSMKQDILKGFLALRTAELSCSDHMIGL